MNDLRARAHGHVRAHDADLGGAVRPSSGGAGSAGGGARSEESQGGALGRFELLPRRRRDVVVDCDEGAVGPAHPTARLFEALEGLRRSHLVHQVPVDVQEAGASRDLGGGAIHEVRIPNLARRGKGAGQMVFFGDYATYVSVASPALSSPARASA